MLCAEATGTTYGCVRGLLNAERAEVQVCWRVLSKLPYSLHPPPPQHCRQTHCQWHAISPLSLPQAEKRNGNTVLSLRFPTDATKRSQTEWSKLTARSRFPPVVVEYWNPSLEKISLRFRPFLRNTGGCGWAIPDGVSFLMFVYFDKTACLPVLLVFRWVLPQGRGVEGAYR